MTSSDVEQLKRFRKQQILARFRALGPMPNTGHHQPALTTSQMMKFNVFEDATTKRRSKSKKTKKRVGGSRK
tara:strand:- start:13399 stop:13614 length:216 start_codon:yes stop_codon:yes gene_type:complete